MKGLTLCLVASLLCHIVTTYKLTIMHTNDVHSRFEEAHKYGGVCSESHKQSNSCVGGVARRATEIKRIRREKGNATLLLDGGDQFQGTFWFYVYQGEATAYFMKLLGYDAMALGNHEFDSGLPTLQSFIDNVTDSFSVLSSNIDNSKEQRLQGYKPYIIKEVDGRNVGIIGYTTIDTPELTGTDATGKLVFNDVVESVRNALRELKAEDPTVNVVIAVGHAGFGVDKKIAEEVDGVDVVVGGHTNTFLYTGDEPSNEKPVGDYPYVVEKPDGKKVLCVQAFYFSKYLGYLEVEFDSQGDITAYQGNPILLDSSIAKDADVEARLEPYREKVEVQGNVALGTTLVNLDSSCREKECNMGNLIADAWIHSNTMFTTDIRWARASVAILNGGSIRAPIVKGNITNADLLTTLPFGNTVTAVTVSGKTLKSVLERSIGTYNQSSNGGFLQVSGIHVKYDISKPVGNRVVSVDILCLACDVPVYESLMLDTEYNLLTTDFLVSGGDGYSIFKDAIYVENLGLGASNMVAEYLRQIDKVYPSEEGRIQFVTEKEKPAACAFEDDNSASKSSLSILSAVLLLSVLNYIIRP